MNNFKQKLMVAGITLTVATTTVLASDYEQHWAKNAIDKWSSYGVVKGYEDQTFRPNGAITRAEFATILSRVLGLSSVANAPVYADLAADTEKWYVEAVNQVMAQKLMNIEGENFKPNQAITRQEAAYAIARAYGIEASERKAKAFTDDEEIAAWAKGYVYGLVETNYLNGNPDGSFKPQGTLTRAELVTLLNNITEEFIQKPGTYTSSVTGNVVVGSSDVILKDMTIEGNLYLTDRIGEKAIYLENVTVTGKVVVRNSNVVMSGAFNTVQIDDAATVSLTQGTIKTVTNNEMGAKLKVSEGAAVEKIVQNQALLLEGTGSVEGKQITDLTQVKVQAAGIYINDKYIDLPVNSGKVIIDVPVLSKTYKASDVLTGLRFATNLKEAEITSPWGKVVAGEQYTFHQTEEELGILRQLALEVGIDPELVISYVLGDQKVTFGGLLEDYATAQKIAASLNIKLKDNYEFVRVANQLEGRAGLVTIELRLK